MTLGDKIKNAGAQVKDALTPGNKHDSTTTYTEKGPATYDYEGAGTGAAVQRSTDYQTTGVAGNDNLTNLGAGEGAYTKEAAGYGAAGTGTAYGTGDTAAGILGKGQEGDLTQESGRASERNTNVGSAAVQGQGHVLGQDYYTSTEDRSRVKEVTERVREHRPVEKEFVVETRATGNERDLKDDRSTEHLGTRERIVEGAEGQFGSRERQSGGGYSETKDRYQ